MSTGTYIATYGEETDEAGCGEMAPFNKTSATYKLGLHGPDGDAFYVSDEAAGCSLIATLVEPSTLVANGASCRILPGGILEQYGVTDRTFQRFELDFEQGTVVAQATTKMKDGARPYTQCSLFEQRSVEAPTKGRLLRFEGPYNGDLESENPDCGETASFWTAIGYVHLDIAADRTGAKVYEEASGCEIDLTSADGNVFTAPDNTACRFESALALPSIGYPARVFDGYRLDLDAMTLNYQVRHTRISYDGTMRHKCSNAEFALSDG